MSMKTFKIPLPSGDLTVSYDGELSPETYHKLFRSATESWRVEADLKAETGPSSFWVGPAWFLLGFLFHMVVF